MIDCSICKTHCCGGSPIKAPIILPFELDRFKGQTNTVDGVIHWLNRKTDGTCIHLNSANRCTIYNDRPTECRLYPWVISFKNGDGLVLSEGCPQRSNAFHADLPESVKTLSAEYKGKFEQEQE